MPKFVKAFNLLNVTRGSTSPAYAHTTDRMPIYYYDADDYDQVSGIFFTASLSAGTGGGNVAYMELYNFTDSTSVTGSEISTTSTTLVSVTSGDIEVNMTTAKEYLTRWKQDDGAGGTPSNNCSFNKATILIKQDGAITKTRTDIELGEDNDVPSTSYTAPTNYGIFLFESARFDGTVTVYLEAVLRCQSSGDTTYGALYDITAAAQVSSSEVSHTGNTTKTRKRSGAITLVDGHEYRPDIKGTATNDDVASVSIIIKQTGTPTKTDCYIPILNTSSSGTGSTYAYQNRYLDFDDSDYDGDTKTFKYEATLNSSAGNTAYYNLYNDTDTTELAVVTATSATYVRSRDDTVTMPTDDNNVLNSGRKIDTAGTVSAGRSFLIAQMDWSPVAEGSTYPSWNWGGGGW